MVRYSIVQYSIVWCSMVYAWLDSTVWYSFRGSCHKRRFFYRRREFDCQPRVCSSLAIAFIQATSFLLKSKGGPSNSKAKRNWKTKSYRPPCCRPRFGSLDQGRGALMSSCDLVTTENWAYNPTGNLIVHDYMRPVVELARSHELPSRLWRGTPTNKVR